MSLVCRFRQRTPQFLTLAVIVSLVAGCSFDEHRTRAKYIAVGNARFARGSFTEALAVYDRVIHSDPRNREAYFRAGITAVRLQNWGDAIRYLQRAIELDPDRLEAYSELANVDLFVYSNASPSVRAGMRQELNWLSDQLHKRFADGFDDVRLQGYLALFSNDKKLALENFSRAHALKPADAGLTLVYVETLLWADHVEEAEAIAAHTAGSDPSLTRVYDALVAHYLRANRTADVERVLRQELGKNRYIAEAHLELAAIDFARRRFDEMNVALKGLSEDKEHFPLGALQAGDFYLRTRDYDRARSCYQQGIGRGEPFKVAYQKRMIEILVKQNKLGEAQNLIGEISKTTKDAETRAIAASLKVLAGDTKQLPSAISEFQSLSREMPFDVVLKYLHGRAQFLTGDSKGGIHQMEQAIELRPDYLAPRISLTQAMIDDRNYGEMILIAKGIIANEGTDLPFETAGQRPHERPIYELILGMRPQSATALNNLAVKIADTGLGLPEALALAQHASRQQPADESIAATLAWMYVKNQQPDAAIGILRPLVDHNPNRANYRYRLAMALFVKGDRNEAKRECESALRSTNDLDEATNIRELISRIGQSRS